MIGAQCARPLRRSALALLALTSLFAPAPAAAENGVAPKHAPPLRWTARTPDAMLELALARARTSGDLSGVVLAYALADRAAAGHAQRGLDELGRGEGLVAEAARWASASLAPKQQRAPGLVRHFALVGPFQDTGGGLGRREGPELAGATWGDPRASYAWGAFQVAWRAVPDVYVSARGIPLDLFVAPRKESCTYLATKVTVTKREPILFHVASSGAVRAIWDGVDAGSSEELHEAALLDRLAFRVDPPPGDHLLALKVCSGAPEDQGRVRVHATDPSGAPIDLRTSEPSAFSPATAKPAPTLAPTALERAAALEPRASAERALSSCVVRALGKADDLRSPRAPGLVDKVASDPSTSADMLAIAGWVSPFGAVRSGWLNRAVERARAEADLDTLSFALRRIAIARTSARWNDWAMATIGGEPLASDTDAEAEVVRALVRGGIGLESLRRGALDVVLRRAERDGPSASIALWDAVSTLSGKIDPKLHARAKVELAARAPEGRDESYVQALAVFGKKEVAQAAREALSEGGITSADDLLHLAETLDDAGLRGEAAAVFERGVNESPNHADLWRGFAEHALLDGREAAGTRALERARALEPADTRLRAETAYRGGANAAARSGKDGRGPGAGAVEPDDAAYLATAPTFLARKAAAPVNPGEVADRQLHWTRVVTFHPDRRVSQLIQYAREIVVEPRSQDELYEQIPAEGEETEVVRARVHRARGGVAFAEEEKSEGGRPVIRWPDLKTGDVVEVVVRTWTSGPVGRRGDPPFYFVDYAGSVSTHPLLFNEVVVDSPADRPLAVDVLHGKPDRVQEQSHDGRKIVHMIWDQPPNLPDEPLAPKSSEILPTVVGSTFSSWNDFREWYLTATDGFTEPDDQVRRLAAELTRGKTTRDAKVKAVFDFVADDIRYVNYVSGEWWLPNRPQQLLARRQGDCDDKAILLITLLRALGIDATEVLLQTRYTAQPSILSSSKAAVPLFDHGIAYLPGSKGTPGLWLDATSPQSRMGPLPAMDARAKALSVTQGPPSIVATPEGRPNEHAVDGTWTLRLAADGSGELDALERHTGDHAFVLRSALRESDARAQWVEQNLIAGWIPTVHVTGAVDFTPELPDGASSVHYRAHSDGLGRREGDEMVVPLSPVSTLTSMLAPLVRRTLPVVLPPSAAPSSESRTLRIIAPTGYVIVEPPPSGAEDGGEFGSARLDVRARGAREVEVKRTLVFDLSTVPVDKYDAWRAWLRRVDSLLHRAVRFAPAGRPSAPEKGARGRELAGPAR